MLEIVTLNEENAKKYPKQLDFRLLEKPSDKRAETGFLDRIKILFSRESQNLYPLSAIIDGEDAKLLYPLVKGYTIEYTEDGKRLVRNPQGEPSYRGPHSKIAGIYLPPTQLINDLDLDNPENEAIRTKYEPSLNAPLIAFQQRKRTVILSEDGSNGRDLTFATARGDSVEERLTKATGFYGSPFDDVTPFDFFVPFFSHGYDKQLGRERFVIGRKEDTWYLTDIRGVPCATADKAVLESIVAKVSYDSHNIFLAKDVLKERA